MKNIREYDFWQNSFFSAGNKRSKHYDNEVMFFVALAGAILGFLVIGVLLATIWDHGGGLLVGLVIGIILPQVLIRLGPVYKGFGLPTDYNYNFEQRYKEYLSLSKTDRALYPDDILGVMRNEDLNLRECREIDEAFRTLYSNIKDRQKAERALSARHVDVASLLEQVKHQNESLAIDIKTLKEFS